MVKIIAFVILITLAIIGLVDIIFKIALAIMMPEKEKNHALLVKLEGENAEFQLRSAIEKRNHFGTKAFCKIFAVDCGVTDEILHICSVIACENADIIVCKSDDLHRKINEEL